VAEERARIARELHDIAHAVSVMVLQVGAVDTSSRGVELSAYRIVQEGLTNALKHAHASDADVTVRYRPDELEIEVRDDSEGGSASDGLGHGLVGIRERVKIYGGEMTAGTHGYFSDECHAAARFVQKRRGRLSDLFVVERVA
jgi:signal transduction histidine kinase